MKRFSLVISVLAFLAMIGCDKMIESSPVVLDSAKTATVKIFLLAETDLTKSGDEPAPQGTMVTFSYNYSDLEYAGPDYNGLEGRWSSTLEVDADGMVEVKIPVDDNGVNLKISAEEFVFDQVQASGSSASTVGMLYQLTNKSMTIAAGETKVESYTYTAKSNEVPQLNATIIGVVYAELDLNSFDLEPAPAGTKVLVSNNNNDFETIVTVGADGQFVASVKVDEDGDDFTVKALSFTYDQVQALTENVSTKKMEYSAVQKTVSSLMPNDTKYTKLEYGNPTEVGANVPTEFIEIGGYMYADLNQEQAGDETFPANTQFIFFTENEGGTNWSETVSVNNLGYYKVNVPKDEVIYFACDFEVQRRVFSSGVYVQKTYRCNVSGQMVTGGVDYTEGDIDLYISNSRFTEVSPVNK